MADSLHAHASLHAKISHLSCIIHTHTQEENREKIVEAHLMTDFDADFYGNEMRLILAGQQRPEQKFASFPELLAAIKQASSHGTHTKKLIRLSSYITRIDW